MGASSYTILIDNELLRRGHYQGTYASYGEAEEAAQRQAARTRKFATYQIYTGTPRKPGSAVGPLFRGTQ